MEDNEFTYTGKDFALGGVKADPDPDARRTIIDMLIEHPGETVDMGQFVNWRLQLGMSRDWTLDLIMELANGGLIERTDNVDDVMAWKVAERTMILDRWR
jgi:hypothetical protein